MATLRRLEDPSVFRTPPTPQTIFAERHSGPQPTLYLACGGALRRCTTGKWLCPLEHCEDVPLRRCSTAKMYHCGALRSCGSVQWSTANKSRLPADIAAHLQREKKRRATPTAQWKVQWREWQDWALLEPQTLQKLLTQSWKHGVSLVQYTWPVKGHKVQFEVDLAKLEVRNMKTNKGYPLQCSGPL